MEARLAWVKPVNGPGFLEMMAWYATLSYAWYLFNNAPGGI